MSRVVGGAARGRRLRAPAGRGTRPTSDRAREGMFSTLQSVLGPLDGARVLDLYAGTGAVGLEALSRGAAHVLLVESDRKAAAVIAENVAQVGLDGAVVRTATVEHVITASSPEEPYDLAFLDPPYSVTDDEVRVVLSVLLERGWLAPGSVAVVERPSRGGALAWPDGYAADRERRYGEGTLWYGRAAGEASGDERE